MPESKRCGSNIAEALADELRRRIDAAMAAAHVPRQDTALAAPALVGALLEGLIGPLAPQSSTEQNDARAAVQTLTLLSLRALGVVDARARGLVVQTVLPWRMRIASMIPKSGNRFSDKIMLAKRRYCSVASAIQSVTARKATSGEPVCSFSLNTAICASAEVPASTIARQCFTSAGSRGFRRPA